MTQKKAGPFSCSCKERDPSFRKEMTQLNKHHQKLCLPYRRLCQGLGQEMPRLPVSLFKDLDLRSIPDTENTTELTSSGTTGQHVSHIYLDAETAAAQQEALYHIVSDFIGTERMPMLIIDSPDVLRNRSKFTARGAGILGFSLMSTKRFYALDSDMHLNFDAIRACQEKAARGPVLIFGFTFMIWKYFYQPLKRSGKFLDLSGGYLIHGGGWKKLQKEAVSKEQFDAGLKEVCSVRQVIDYYGMAEQTGSIFMECEYGHLHVSRYSDVHILNPEDFSECPMGQAGLISTESILPESYPGHCLLTEDTGRILGADDCPCGRKGKYFTVDGRIRKAEVRGCSDTYEESSPVPSDRKSSVRVLAGTFPPQRYRQQSGSEIIRDFLEELSGFLLHDPACRKFPEVYAFGFWCRKKHLDSMLPQNLQKRRGKGMVIHIAPSNMPMMFAYSWLTSLLAGNSNIVRITDHNFPEVDYLCDAISRLMQKGKYRKIQDSNALIRFPRNENLVRKLFQDADVRIIWGGDETVARLTALPAPETCSDLTFPSKYSISLFDASFMEQCSAGDLHRYAQLFCQDTYAADQNACSSPMLIFWKKGDLPDSRLHNIQKKWWTEVFQEARHYPMDAWKIMEKYRLLCLNYMQTEGLYPPQTWKNTLWVVDWDCCSLPEQLWTLPGKFGLFYQTAIRQTDEILPYMKEKIQTITTIGTDPKLLWKQIRACGCPGVDRIVPVGEALQFSMTWDRKDLLSLLSEPD